MKSFIRDLENPERKLIDKTIEIICHCVEIYDDNVHLQIIKSSLTAVTSCDISSTSFSNAFLACFNIFLITRNQNNQSLSRVILNQMTNLIFQRYEVYFYQFKDNNYYIESINIILILKIISNIN